MGYSGSAFVSLHLTHIEVMMIVRRVLLREMPENVGHVGVDVRREAQVEVRAVLDRKVTLAPGTPDAPRHSDIQDTHPKIYHRNC